METIITNTMITDLAYSNEKTDSSLQTASKKPHFLTVFVYF